MLLETTDLADGPWLARQQRTFRTGAGQPQTDETRRARKNGSITAMRTFRHATDRRTLTCSVIPFAAPSDAQAYVPKIPNRMMRIPFSKFKSYGTCVFPAGEVSAMAEGLAYEERFAGPKDSGCFRLLAGTVDEIVFTVQGAAVDGHWEWDELERAAASQVQKVRDILGN